MKPETAKDLLEKVKNDYSSISDEFSATRKWLWPEFKFFKKYIKKDQNIFDIGCGNGRLSQLFSDYPTIKYTGIDNNKELIAIAQKTYPRSNFLCNDLLNFDLPTKSNLMFSIASFHHIPSTHLRNICVRNIRDNLQNEGVIVLTAWNLFQKRYRMFIMQSVYNFLIQWGKYDWNDTFIPWGKSNVKRYYHAFTPGELKKLFKNNGFEILEMFYTKKDKKVSFFNSHNICLVCRKK